MHPDISEEKFKLALATDLVIYMVQVWTHGNPDQVTLVNDLMNARSERIETNANYMKKQIAQQMTETNEQMTEDVATILLDINNVENKVLKGEFKSQMREAIFKGLAAYSKK